MKVSTTKVEGHTFSDMEDCKSRFLVQDVHVIRHYVMRIRFCLLRVLRSPQRIAQVRKVS